MKASAIEWESPEIVHVAALRVDQSYQSPLSEPRAREIAKRFNPHAAGAIVVSRRVDGSLWVIDGQTRTAAAKRACVPTLMAWVHDGLSVEQEAAMYADLNTVRKTPSARNVFRARLTAHVEPYVSIAAAVESHGLTLSLSNSKSAKTVSCVGTVTNIWKVDSGVRLGRTLDIAKAAWPDAEKAFDSAILLGISYLIKAVEGRYADERIARRLATVEPAAIVRKAAFARHEAGDEIGRCASRVMLAYVEKRTPRAKRIGDQQ